jgi:hypothetical protein
VLAVLLVLGLVVAGVGASWWWYRDRQAAEQLPGPAASRSCSTPPVTLPRNLPSPSAISVSVSNGTNTPGLAVETADDLVARGFDVSSIGNTDQPVKNGVAQVRYGRGDLASAVVVASFVPGAKLVEVDRRISDVALWIGPEFTGVATADDADVESVILPPGKPVCRRQ